MLSIHTNLSSIIAQQSLSTSTNRLNQAIERMSTGYKINHASDNAANYSISQNINVQMSSYDIAADNISMGMDLLQTAQDTIAGMQVRGSRLQAIITQARNGTYGASSLAAMSREAQALISEINRLYVSTEYNAKQLFEIQLPDWAKEVKSNAGLADGEAVGTLNGKSLEQCAVENNGFISEVVCDTPEVTIYSPAELANAISTKTIIGIGNAETFAELANLVNGTSTYVSGARDCSGKTIILMNDVDLSAICAANTDSDGNGGWNPIGMSPSKIFQGIFNGNGHKVSGLYIRRADSSYQGLFGYSAGEIKNIGVEVNITGADNTGGVAGSANKVSNCYSKGKVVGNNLSGGLIGLSSGLVTDSYANVLVEGNKWTGGLVGEANNKVTNCYTIGNISGASSSVGGLVGQTLNTTTNCYSIGNVTGVNWVGGLIGSAGGTISDCYATGDVVNLGENTTGGIAGFLGGNISNCYATGNVSGYEYTGGLVGDVMGSITNCYSTGDVMGEYYVGGLVGYSEAITDCYATGTVIGSEIVGGLIGCACNSILKNSYSTGQTSGDSQIGGLVGLVYMPSGTMAIDNVLAAGIVAGSEKTGSLIGNLVDTNDGTNFSTINITNAFVQTQSAEKIGFEGVYYGPAYASGQMETWLENTTAMEFGTLLQVGVNGDSSSQIKVNTTFNYNLNISNLTSDSAFNSVTEFLNTLNSKATELGAAQNRLESALESTLVSMDNLTSSLSTIRDADIAKVSSQYIRQQILQQAAATLMSTANQTPSIALQLL